MMDLGDNALLALLSNEKFIQAAGMCVEVYKERLQAKPTSTCGRCRANEIKKNQDHALTQLKQCIAGLPKTKLMEIKTIFNADKIKISYPTGNRKRVQITF